MSAILCALRPALSLFVLLSVLTGLVYPLSVTLLAQTLFPAQAAGSLIRDGDRVIGSALVGQPFSAHAHFWSRPSATAMQPYNGLASGGSNFGANNPALLDAVAQRIAALRNADPDNRTAIPVDLVTASASGLDPDISLAAAHYQAARVARASGLARATVDALIDRHAQHPWLGVIGEPRVNVLALNRAIDLASRH
ncbi:MAG: potassium-transporting ATPase subunit KdpC [Gammaproteobacteria bacterium]|jgi:potassium-transporting ATPase KdpC subunit|nr:potassium-transporting ATPase subunit KdpC [Gammaproteobacteria bacterium]MBU0771116.1 potassium-transporting ATPase subunit KdpC [Gammaproteobacteria bacterium]MBU0855863.1 potassium-transporting ATPase subunit KdpC [Gammaproteobacteria bacterium]MBU1849071.1 potassium-transporting ATPase subunit KdpC [Gammaproteobacteria bacterium]